MNESALLLLATASSLLFGAGGAALGLYLGARSVQRDVGLYRKVVARADALEGDMASLKIAWGGTLEQIEDALTTVEKKRRQAAASASSASRSNGGDPPPPPPTAAELRMEARRRVGSLGG